MHVDPSAPKKGQPSSFIRELAAILLAIQFIICKMDGRYKGETFVILTDNEGLANAFAKNLSPKNHQEFKLLADFYVFLPEGVNIEVSWHRRTEPLAAMADRLSKIEPLLLRKAFYDLARQHDIELPQALVSQTQLLFHTDFFLKQIKGKMNFFIIHPLLNQTQARMIREKILKAGAGGFLLSPACNSIQDVSLSFRLTEEFVKNMISLVKGVPMYLIALEVAHSSLAKDVCGPSRR